MLRRQLLVIGCRGMRHYSHYHRGQGPSPQWSSMVHDVLNESLKGAMAAGNDAVKEHSKIVTEQVKQTSEKSVDMALSKMISGMERNLTKLNGMSKENRVSVTATADLGIFKFSITAEPVRYEDEHVWNPFDSNGYG